MLAKDPPATTKQDSTATKKTSTTPGEASTTPKTTSTTAKTTPTPPQAKKTNRPAAALSSSFYYKVSRFPSHTVMYMLVYLTGIDS